MIKSNRSEAFVRPLKLSWKSQHRTRRCTCRPREQHVLTAFPNAGKRSAVSGRSPVFMRDQLDKHGRRYIRLEQFIKLQGMAETGGQAKMLIHEGLVFVNGQTEVRRGRKLVQDDGVRVEGDDMELMVDFRDEDEAEQKQTSRLY
ncbi:hypothetical protein BWQ96_07194 [Gracilariopsis chorda]|uniref:Uncharacterized protein n=1 Tax=Gracilariopsis chorda TaxID=448386 RepID=A0A2V3ILX2_9FLOR|nr:hypothetical protein BWQ96_07194 [Gracilariopsis chorda]|eukprot:PXF43047.1 hypothetical protein BWQ96_07194 [Gracilariopsis chorda]